ncbi:hypothetical protein [Geothrix sp. 21YS21S-2]|uniref:hypothetical protein n=1 Tax=Geothrix sp. 21YS21S-2 TaxID=3068893 RepID=UPI0027BA84B3|nr:hypothetical protein [Geothrix sp. 21YS21S-2]
MHLITAAAASFLLILAPACTRRSGSGGSVPTPTEPAAPKIASFQADKSIITKGDSAILTFAFEGGTATLDPNLGPVTSGGSLTVSPDQDTDYTLTVKGADNAAVHRVVTVKVAQAPAAPEIQAPAQVATFQTGMVATVPFEAGSTYKWSISNGSITSGQNENTVTFDAGATGDLVLTCVVSNAAGKEAKASTFTVAVRVSTITDFKASPARITAGRPTSLMATFTGGTGLIEPGGLPITSGTAVVVTPAGDTTYTLTVHSGTTPLVSSQTLVKVLPALAATPITVSGAVQAGISGYQARVAPQAGCTYRWRIGNGTLTAGDGTDTVTFTAGVAGPLTLDCTITNPAGDSIDAPSLALTVQSAPAPGALAVSLLRPAFPAYGGGLRAEVNPEPGATYAWTLSDGTIDLGAGTNAIVFTAGGPAPATLRCAMTLADGSTREGSVGFTPTYPVIDQFAPNQSVVTAGRNATLNFTFSGGTGTLSPGNLAVTSPGSVQVAPGTYTLTVLDAAGNVDRAERTISTVPMPTITRFTTSHPILGPGREADLTAVFDAGPGGTAQVETLGAVTSGQPISTGPLQNGRRFALRVTNAGGDSITRDVTVRVAALELVAGFPSGYGNGDGAARFARFRNPRGLAMDAAGNNYVADTLNHTIRKVAADGTVTTVAGNPGVPGSADGQGREARFNTPVGLALDASGNIYVADFGNATIRKVAVDGTVSTLAGVPGTQGSTDGTNGDVLFREPYGIAVSPDGTQVFVSDRSSRTIRAFNPGMAPLVTMTIAGQDGVPAFMDGPGATARFRQPGGLALGGNGSLYVTDTTSSVIRKLTPQADGTYFVSTVAGRDLARTLNGVTDGDGLTVATFTNPIQIAVDSANNLYVTDLAHKSVRKLTQTPNGYLVSTLAGDTSAMGTLDGHPLTQARFTQPGGLAVDATGTVFLADGQAGVNGPFGNAIRAIPAASNTYTVAGTLPSAGAVNGVGTGAKFREPRGSVSDAAGVAYVCDTQNHAIRRISPDGTVTLLAGNGTPGAVDATGTGARFNQPYAIAIDSAGVLFVADMMNHAIRRVAQDGVVTTVAGDVTQPGGFADGLGTAARFNRPSGIAVDGAGNLYVADRDNHVIRKIDPTGQVTTLAGDPLRADSLDGPAGQGTLTAPFGIALDGAGSLLVSDFGSHTIRKVNLATGALSTLAGDAGAPGFPTDPGYVDANGSLARFNKPASLAVDSDGNAYVADFNNEALRMIAPDGTVTTVLGFAGYPRMRGVAPGPLPTAFAEPKGVSVDPATGNLLVSTPDAVMKVAFR